MSLELKPIDNNNIEVYSNLKLAGTIVRPEIPTPPDGTFKWFFKPNKDCSCVWTDVSLVELGNIIKNMNNEIIKKT